MVSESRKDHSRNGRKVFTVDEANAALPLVRAIVHDLAQLSREVIERRDRLSLLLAGRDRGAGDMYGQELVQIEEELGKDSQRLQEYVEELRQLGVEPKNGPEGLVDFPAMMDGRLVYLCWKLGESEILHWHELDAGFRGRQSLAAGAVALAAGAVAADSTEDGSLDTGSDPLDH